MFFDIDLISYNALIYNGDQEQITIDARKLMEKLRMELRKRINTVSINNPNCNFKEFDKKPTFIKEE